MNNAIRRLVSLGILVGILFSIITVSVVAYSGFQVETSTATIYRDGLVTAQQTLAVNSTFPTITIPLLSSSFDNLIVLDENRTVLDYKVAGQNLTIFTFGAAKVFLEYDTNSLTSKEADVWTLALIVPYNITVSLPEESKIIYLNQIPDSIDSEGTRITLSLFPGEWEISYIFPITPPAGFLITNLKATPTEVETNQNVTISADITNTGGKSGTYTIHFKVNQTTAYIETVALDAGESTTTGFTTKKEQPGKYLVETDGLTTEFTVQPAGLPTPSPPPTPAPSPSPDPSPSDYSLVVIVVMVAVALSLVAFVLFKRSRPNIEKIFKTYPYLRKEDKDVITFLSEKDGKAFEAELRQHFPEMPRTSLWRLVKRLEKHEIVKVKRIGLENQVILRK